ncbi:MAG: terminase small subunit [Candidatus Phlomobacter fragariae]
MSSTKNKNGFERWLNIYKQGGEVRKVNGSLSGNLASLIQGKNSHFEKINRAWKVNMLTTRKKKFAAALHTGKNQREAAIAAGYSEKTAKVKGSQLARAPEVINYLKRLTEEVNLSYSHAVTDNASAGGLEDPVKVMTLIMTNHITTDPKLALEAAAKLAPYVHRKLDDPGKKQLKAEKAQVINRFEALPTPSMKH